MREKFRGKWQGSVSCIIKMLQEIEDKHLQITNTFASSELQRGLPASLLSCAQSSFKIKSL